MPNTNINDTFFDGYYKEIWRAIIPEELTKKEVDFMLPYFNLQTGSKVLDLMCGYGRHTIALAKKGIHVTAVDNLADYVDEIKKVIEEEKLPINAIKNDVITFTNNEVFDLAICMGNSLIFFNPEDVVKLFKNVASHLKQGSNFLINSISIAEIEAKNFKEKSSVEVGELKLLVDSKFLLFPSRIEIDSIITAPNGETESKHSIDYIYSINETEYMLKDAGFILKEVYSIPGRKRFTLGDPRAYLVAEKSKM